MEKKPDVYNPTFWHYCFILPIWILLRLLLATVRIKGDENVRKVTAEKSPFLGVAWHRHILLLAKGNYVFRPNNEMSGLVSASKDGAYLVAFFKLMGINSIRGSKKRRGREAILDLVEAVKAGSDTFITPDGPRGPSEVAKKGFLVVGEAAQCRIFLARFKPSCYFTIPTWDKFIIPVPFSSATLEIKCFSNTDELVDTANKLGMKPEEYATAYCNFKIN